MNRVSLVTGTSRGIGPSTAIRRVEDRYDAVMNYLRQGGTARDDADRIEQAGQRSLAIRADVASRDEVRQMVGEAAEALGPVSVLVNNAGIYHYVTVDQMQPDRREKTLRVNLSGAFTPSKPSSPRCSKRPK